MLGAITGDTIGSSYEFDNTKDYNFRLFTSETAYAAERVMQSWPKVFKDILAVMRNKTEYGKKAIFEGGSKTIN